MISSWGRSEVVIIYPDISSIHHELLDASESDCTSIITYNYMLFFDAGSLEWLPCEGLQPCVLRSGLLVRFSWQQSRQPVESQPVESPSSKSPSSQAAAKAERTRGALLPKPPDKLYPRWVFGENLWETMEVKPPFFCIYKWTNGFHTMFPWVSCDPLLEPIPLKTIGIGQLGDGPFETTSRNLWLRLPCKHAFPAHIRFFEGAKLEPFKTSYFSETMVKYSELMIVGCCSSRFFATFCDYPQLWIYLRSAQGLSADPQQPLLVTCLLYVQTALRT